MTSRRPVKLRRNVKRTFRLTLDVEDRPCLVIGGNDEALDKTTRLLEAGAIVALVAPDAVAGIRMLARARKIRHIPRRYRAGDERGKYFVVNCVNTDHDMARAIYERCERERVIISTWDLPQYSTVGMTSIVRAGKVQLSISSDGLCPGVSRQLRIELETILDRRFARFTVWAAAWRKRMVDAGVSPEERRRMIRGVLKEFRIAGKCVYPKSFLKGKAYGRP